VTNRSTNQLDLSSKQNGRLIENLKFRERNKEKETTTEEKFGKISENKFRTLSGEIIERDSIRLWVIEVAF